MKHSFIRFVGGLISFFGMAEVVTGTEATASTICELKSSNNKVTTYVKMTETAGGRWYVLWGDYPGVAMGGSATQSLYNGNSFQTPAYPEDVTQSIRHYCVTAAPADHFYAISGAGYIPILRPGCAIRVNTSDCGNQLYFENTGLAKDFGCCYSGNSTGTSSGSTGASGGSSGTTCSCWYAEASSGLSYSYKSNSCNIVDVKPINKCFEFINCGYGYYHPYSGMSQFCTDTVPGMLYGYSNNDVGNYGSGKCEIPPIQYQDAIFSNSNGTFNYRRCLNDGCTTTGYIENANNFSVVYFASCLACPSGMADVSNLVSSAYSGLEMLFATTSTISTQGATTGIIYETYGITSCNPSGYTATDSNGHSFVVGGCSTYNK